MRSTLGRLNRELSELRAFVDSISPVNSALAGHQNTLVQQYVSVRRRFDCAAFAVALYASFEQFVEGLIKDYVCLESKRIDYAKLPQKLTRKNLVETAEILRRGQLGEGRYAGLNEKDLVKNLFVCLDGEKPYTLNHVAVVSHDANLRVAGVDELFGMVGIDNISDRACGADAMVSWYQDVQGFENPPPKRVEYAVIKERLKEIVERRNQVAHRGGSPDDLPGYEDMIDSIGFIESFSKSIFGLVVGHYLENNYSEPANYIELVLRKDDGPYKKGLVVVVENPGQPLRVGQPVFAIAGSTGARWGRIQGLRLDNVDLEATDPGADVPNGIGVELDFRFPRGGSVKLVALESDDDNVWSPLA